MGAARMAQVLAQLMSRLGYDRFGVHGYDSGSWVGPEISRQVPDRVIDVHVNAMVTFPIGTDGEFAGLTGIEQRCWQAMQDHNDGYLQCNAKRPQTVAYGLHDSPVGQLAWIVEKFKELTDPEDGMPEDSIDRDRILTGVSLYWLTGTAGSAAQIYYEEMSAGTWDGDGGGGDRSAEQGGSVPMGVLVSVHDVTIRRWAERDHNVVRWTELDRGGRFLSMEAPDLLVADAK
jgi:epoxide hydrolase